MLQTRDCPLRLTDLAAAIRTSSNFRFAWQTYDLPGLGAWRRQHPPQAATDANFWLRTAINTVVADPQLHRFLRDSFDPMYDPEFQIEPLHDHARLEPCPDTFEEILASAAADRLGAYSRTRQPASARQRKEIATLFGQPGPYTAHQLLPGSVQNCPICRRHNGHLFTNWFFGVAWDWCLLAAWPQHDMLWIGCLTDTD